jgi:hypothetical protein
VRTLATTIATVLGRSPGGVDHGDLPEVMIANYVVR